MKEDGDKRMINVDAVVFCTGPHLASMLKYHFWLSCPVVPVKGYSFDMKVDSTFKGTHF